MGACSSPASTSSTSSTSSSTASLESAACTSHGAPCAADAAIPCIESSCVYHPPPCPTPLEQTPTRDVIKGLGLLRVALGRSADLQLAPVPPGRVCCRNECNSPVQPPPPPPLTASATACSSVDESPTPVSSDGGGTSAIPGVSNPLRVPSFAMRLIPTTFSTLRNLLDANRRWAEAVTNSKPGYFAKLATLQAPQLLWLGCSDSRVPANQIVNLEPGEVFVHRNVANVVNHTDLNCLSVIQYAVDVLKVKHIIVCGHYGCGGILASMTNLQYGLIDNWLRNIKDVYTQHEHALTQLQCHNARADLLCELNVTRSVHNVCSTTIVQNAWQRKQDLSVHGWCYRIEDGIIRDLSVCISEPSQVTKIYTVQEKLEAEK